MIIVEIICLCVGIVGFIMIMKNIEEDPFHMLFGFALMLGSVAVLAFAIAEVKNKEASEKCLENFENIDKPAIQSYIEEHDIESFKSWFTNDDFSLNGKISDDLNIQNTEITEKNDALQCELKDNFYVHHFIVDEHKNITWID